MQVSFLGIVPATHAAPRNQGFGTRGKVQGVERDVSDALALFSSPHLLTEIRRFRKFQSRTPQLSTNAIMDSAEPAETMATAVSAQTTRFQRVSSNCSLLALVLR